MDVLVTCKYEEDPIKNEGARVDTTLYSNFYYIAIVYVSSKSQNLNSTEILQKVKNSYKLNILLLKSRRKLYFTHNGNPLSH